MNIVLIDHYAGGPSFGMEFRPYYFAREWQSMGHKVVIVAGSYSHVRNVQPVLGNSNPVKTIDGVDYYWIRTNKYDGNGLGRAWSMFEFSWKVYRGLIPYLKTFKPDLIVASSTYPLENFAIHRLSRKFNCKYCYEVHDLWPLSPIELGGISKTHPFMLLMQWAENYAYKHADFVVSLLPEAKSHMVSHGLEPSKFVYIPNGIVLEEWDETEALPLDLVRSIEEIKSSAKFTVAYAGTHGLANSLDALISAAKVLSKDIAIVLIGDGIEKPRLQMKVKNESINNVYFLPPISKTKIPALLSYFDSFYIGLQKQSLFRFGISPNKIFDYMMAGKPIVQAIEAGNNIVKEYDCGVAVEPDNEQSIRDGIEQLSRLSVDERQRLGNNGRSAVLKYHDYKVLCANFVKAAS